MKLESRFDPETSHTHERLAARAWPAHEVHEVEGWLLRRTEGVDWRRTNSILPPPDPGHAARTVDVALATAEELDMATTVEVSPAEAHARLDDALASRRMEAAGRSLVLAGRLAPAPAARERRRVPALEVRPLDAEWIEAWAALSGSTGTAATAELVLAQLGERAGFAVRRDEDGKPLSVGIGVAEAGWLGIFSLATASSARRGGLASEVMGTLQRWGADRGANRVYLQVERDNAAALAFYAALGMHVAHSYHYRSA
jgi:ribosomal protein S18 acetylase RimI-like enzyme